MASKILLKAAKEAVMHEKPNSSISFWVDKMCQDPNLNSMDGLPELVDSINIQPTGPQEASRALRKKLKYGSTETQLRALYILSAITENANERFRTNFADQQLVDRLKLLAGDPHVDRRVKAVLLSVLASWKKQFSGVPRLMHVAELYDHVKGGGHDQAYAKERERQKEKDEQRRRLKNEEIARRDQERSDYKAAQRMHEEERQAAKAAKKRGGQPQLQSGGRRRFDFEAEKPNIMSAVGNATTACNGLVNALQRVNRDRESVADNPDVQDFLQKTKDARRRIVRYTQLIENDPAGDFIGTLLSTNEQILAALSLYDRWCLPVEHDSDDEADAAELAATAQGQSTKSNIQSGGLHNNSAEAGESDVDLLSGRTAKIDINHTGELERLQDRQKAEVERLQRRRARSAQPQQRSSAHADLEDLMFDSPAGLSEPIKPMHASDVGSTDFDDDDFYGSDSDSSDEETHVRNSGMPSSTSASRGSASSVVNSTSSSSGTGQQGSFADSMPPEDRSRMTAGLLNTPSTDADDREDPFADPFADQGDDVMTPGINENKRMEWRAV